MAYTKLSKKSIKNDDILRTFLEQKPRYTKTVTIAPSKRLWDKFTQHVKKSAGSKKVSRMINYLVATYLDDAKPSWKDWSEEETINVTLSVDQEVWERFMEKLKEMYAKHKIQSEVLNEILTEYLNEDNA